MPVRAQFTGFVKPLDWDSYDGSAHTAGPYTTAYRGNYSNGSEGSGSHPGVDITRDRDGNHVTTNTEIHSIYEGIIIRKTIEAQSHGNGWGNSLVIRHTGIPDSGPTGIIFSTYAHLSSFTINPDTGLEWAKGDRVPKGTVIGFVGKTGRVTGIHLHFQIDKNYSDSLYPLHPFRPNRTDGSRDASQETDIPDSDGLVLAHTLNPVAFVESHLINSALPIRLTINLANDSQPIWSPDGNTIAFLSNRFGGSDGEDIFAISSNGTNERLLAQFTITDFFGGRFFDPSWLSTTGDLLVLEHKTFWEVMRFNLSQAISNQALPVGRNVNDGDSPYFKLLLFIPGGQGADSPIASPDGSRIVWTALVDNFAAVPSDQRRFQVRVATGTLNTFIGNTDSAGAILFQTDPGGLITGPKTAAFSPDGRKLCIAACRQGWWTQGKRRDLYIIDLSTGTAQRLTTTGEHGEDNSYVAWSSQNVLAFASRLNDSSDYDLYTIRPDGTGLTRLTQTPWNEIDPSWAPDGSRLVFASNKEGNYDLYITIP